MRDVVIQIDGYDEIVLIMNVIEPMIKEHEEKNPTEVFDKILLKENKRKWLFKILYRDKK